MATITQMAFRINSFYNGEGMRQARRDIQRLDSSMNALTKSSQALLPGMRDMVSVALAMGPALIPIAGALAGIGAAGGAAFATAGAAVGIYAIALKGAIASTVGQGSAVGSTAAKLQTAQKALDNTTKGTEEYDKALKKVTQAEKAHEAAIAALPPVQEKFARAYDGAKASILEFNTANAKFTLGPATTMINAFVDALPKVTPLLKAMNPEIQRVADNIRGWVNDGGLDRFIRTLIDYGVPALRNFIQVGANIATGMGEGLRAFAPAGVEFTEWLKDVTSRFARWSNEGGFGGFLAWLQTNGPQLMQIARDLGTFMKNMGTAVNDMSGSALTVLGTFFKVLASFPPGLLTAMMYAFIGINLALKVYAVVAFVAAAATTAMTLAATPFGILLLGMALTIAGVVAALIALGVGIYFLIKYWDEVSSFFVNTWQATWGWLKDMWGKLWNGIKDVAKVVWDFLTNGWGQTLLLLMGPLGIAILIWQNWDMIWNGIKSVALTVWDALTVAWDATVGAIMTAWNAVVGPIKESWNTVWPELKEAATNVWNVLKAAWNLLWTGIKVVWEAFWGSFGGTFTTAWSGAVETTKAVWSTLTAAWQLVWSIIHGIYTTAWAILSAAWDIGWTYITGTAKIAWAILTGAWEVLWSVITGIWNVFYATFAAIFKAAWNTIVVIVTGVWEIIKAAWDTLWKVVTAIFVTFLAIFTGNWGKAWNTIKDAALAIWNLIQTAWNAFLNVLRSLLDGFINIVKAAWSAFWTAVQNTATTFWNALRNLFTTFLNAVRDLWNTVWNAVKTIFTTVVNAIKDIATSFWNFVRSLFTTALTAVKNVWDTTWTAIRNFFTTAINGLRTSAEQLWTWMREIFNAGSNWLRVTFWNPVRDFFTKTIPNAFKDAVGLLGKAWDLLRKAVRDPIQAVVNVVYNNGIVKLWNIVAGVFGAKKLSAFTLPQFAAGGSTGKGPGKAKGFPAVLHPNEHVWTAREVAAAGGHEAVAKMRSDALRGKRVRVYGRAYGKFEDGGGLFGTGLGPDVGPDLVPDGIIKNAFNKLKDVVLGGVYKVIEGPVNAAVKMAQSAVRGIIPGDPMLEELAVNMPRVMADTVLNWIKTNDVAPTVAGGSVEAALTWAKSQVGKPYQWGGVGPAGYDCSGFMGAIQNVIMGNKPNKRMWATGAFSGATAPSGWKQKEKAPFMVGITNAGVGHTAGTLNGVNVESSGGVGVRVGGGARGYNNGMFTSWYGFVPSKNAGGSSVAAAKAAGKGMLGQYGWTAQWPDLDALWMRESGWRWNADNPTSDAYGIPQALPGSKMASAGKDWKTNASTQIRWGLGYIKSRYGSPAKANAFQKANNWYGRGTHSAYPGWAVVGDTGPEIMRMRGGEQIDPIHDLVGRAGGGDTNISVVVHAPGATHAVVDRLNMELPEKLRIALEQGTGKKS